MLDFESHYTGMSNTVLVKRFAHLNQDFLLASLEERGKLWKWLTFSSGVLQLTNFLWIRIVLFILDQGPPPPPGRSQEIHEINVRNF